MARRPRRGGRSRTLAATTPSASGRAASAPTAVASVPGGALPVVRAHRYRMAGRIRPLLFWMGRDHVGFAHIAWRADEAGARAFEFLVGTDPVVAPRRINRWGHTAEQHVGRDGTLLAVMARSDEQSVGEVEAREGQGKRAGDFQAIRGVIRGGQASWQVAPVRTSTDLTIHEVGALLPRVESDTAAAQVQLTSLGPDVRPGFLTAVAELVARTATRRDAGRSWHGAAGAPVPYAFGRRLFAVRVRSFELVASPRRELTGEAAVAHVGFEIRTLATGDRTRFEMTYPLEGELAGVPLRIRWQPRWWLQVELTLDADAGHDTLAGTSGPSRPGSPPRSP